MSTKLVDLYAVLGVSKNATGEELRRAYRKLARKHHPDAGGSPEQFRKVSESYQILSDPYERSLYDRRAGKYGSDFSELFSEAFGEGFDENPRAWKKGKWKNPQALRGYDVQTHMSITFQEAFTGADVPLQTQRDTPCPKCNPLAEADSNTSCGLCSSSPGWITELRTIRVFVPAGVFSGERIRLTEEGGWGTPRGDVYVRIIVEEDPRFTPDGDNLRIRAFVDPEVAATGGVTVVSTPDGASVSIPVPVGVQTGSILRLRGYGPVVRSGKNEGNRGDLYIDLLVPPRKRNHSSADI